MGILQNYESPLFDHGSVCGILVHEPIRLRIGRTDRPFRRLRCSRPTSLLCYVSWNLFLLFWLIGWILRIYGMIFPGYYGFPSTKGLEHLLLPYAITVRELEQFDRGVPVVKANGARLLDPAVDEVVRLHVIRSAGDLTLDGDVVQSMDPPFPWSRWTPRLPGGRVVVAIEIEGRATYQDLVTTLDWVQQDTHTQRGLRQVVVLSFEAE